MFSSTRSGLRTLSNRSCNIRHYSYREYSQASSFASAFTNRQLSNTLIRKSSSAVPYQTNCYPYYSNSKSAFSTTASTTAATMPAKKTKSDAPQSPSKRQKQEHDRDLREPHELTSESTETTGEDHKDPYPNVNGSSHDGGHDTTTTHEAEEAKKQEKGCEWRDQPPYRTEGRNEHAKKIHEAQCNCGRIKYWLSRDKPLASKYCHCTDCQSLHGAPFQWAAIFKKEDLHFENGAKGLAFYHAQKKHTYHDLPCKVSCAYCHAPIMDEGRNMVLMFPAIIKFKSEEAKKGFQPTMHIFYSRRCLDITDGKTKWAELDEKSEEIPETG